MYNLIVTGKAGTWDGKPYELELSRVVREYTDDAIQRACAEVGLRCLRADDLWQESAVIQEVFNLLVRSCIVIVDFSGRISNVMYETGIAHTLGRHVIPISQSLDDVPFDLRHHRVLKYLPNAEGLTSMQADLAKRLKTLRLLMTASI
jgi:hypothetical protein